ncbi:MAG: universal stress protein [Candidatus Melainabacteria bacterium]|nr:universal stress protein [Candidatus Melainabacteria bacterium]
MNILLAIDNSSHSRVAVDVVLNRVWPAGSNFKVFCAVERNEPMFAIMKREEAEEFHIKALEAATKLTASVAEELKEKFKDCNAVGEAIFGDSKESILAHLRWPADLIVVGSRGHHGLPRLFLGSVSQTILLYAGCPTLIARYQHAHEGMPEFDKNILVAIDNTPHSRSVVEWVLDMPWPEGAHFKLVSALPPLADKYSDGIDALYARKFSGERLATRLAAEEFSNEVAKRLRSEVGANRVAIDLPEGDPAEIILSIATDWPAGLVVMGSRARGHVTRLFMGSISQEVVLRAPCPVEVVKSPYFSGCLRQVETC